MKKLGFPLVALSLLTACGSSPQQKPAATLPSANITVAKVAQVDHATLESLSGTVKAATMATLMARVPGVVSRITATPGTLVAAGAVLVELEAKEIAAKRDQAKALAAQAAADLERSKTLFDKQVLSKSEMDAAQARAAVSAAVLAEAEIMLSFTSIRAPFAGIIVRKYVENGDLLAPGRPILDLEDPSSLRLEVAIPESLAAAQTLGSKLRVQIPAATFDQETTIVEVTPAADPISRSVLIKIALPASAQGLRSGQFGRAALTVTHGAILAVPNTAIVQRGQIDAVFIIENGLAHLRLVRLGSRDTGSTTIRAGLNAGETVATSDVDTLQDGQPVSVR